MSRRTGGGARWLRSRYRFQALDRDGEPIGRILHTDTIREAKDDALAAGAWRLRIWRRVRGDYEHHADYHLETKGLDAVWRRR